MLLFLVALLAGADAQQPPPPTGRIDADVTYLQSLATVHEYCADDFEVLCSGEAPRRLSTAFVSVLSSDTQDVTELKSTSPLGLGRREDACLRAAYGLVSEQCRAALALAESVDATTLRAPPGGGACALALAVLALVVLVSLAAHRRRQGGNKFKILAAIRANPELLARVEAAAGCAVPAAPACAARGWRTVAKSCALAGVLGWVLSCLVGAGAVLAAAWAVLVVTLAAKCCASLLGCRAAQQTSDEEQPGLNAALPKGYAPVPASAVALDAKVSKVDTKSHPGPEQVAVTVDLETALVEAAQLDTVAV